jgi:hypothetical protein
MVGGKVGGWVEEGRGWREWREVEGRRKGVTDVTGKKITFSGTYHVQYSDFRRSVSAPSCLYEHQCFFPLSWKKISPGPESARTI